MKKRGFEPTDSHLTALFNACANSPFKEDGLTRAIKLRRQLTEQNKLLNRQQYHAMIKGSLEYSIIIDLARILLIFNFHFSFWSLWRFGNCLPNSR